MLVPTTILAQQHLATFRERYGDLPGERGHGQPLPHAGRDPRGPRRAIRDGRLDILIGTHRLLSMDVQPKDLGLVIVDEEQRFGVAQKEALRQLAPARGRAGDERHAHPAHAPDLAVGAARHQRHRDAAGRAGGRSPPTSASTTRRWSSRPCAARHARGGQSFYLHNRVETIEEAASQLRALVPELRIVTAHGQMARARARGRDADVRARRGRRARGHEHHRVGARHPPGEHAGGGARRPARAVPALPDPRAGSAART